MAVYKINSTGNEIEAEQPFMDANYPGNYTLITSDSSPVFPTKITRLAMMNRIGETAMAQLYGMQSSNSTVAAYLAEMQAATFIDLSSAETQTGLNELVTLNVLTTAQVQTILTTSVQAIEQP